MHPPPDLGANPNACTHSQEKCEQLEARNRELCDVYNAAVAQAREYDRTLRELAEQRALCSDLTTANTDLQDQLAALQQQAPAAAPAAPAAASPPQGEPEQVRDMPYGRCTQACCAPSCCSKSACLPTCRHLHGWRDQSEIFVPSPSRRHARTRAWMLS